MRLVPSRCDPGVQSVRSWGVISAKSKVFDPGLWVHRRSRRVRFGCNSKSKSNGEVEGCKVEGLWALGSWRDLDAISLFLFARESRNGLK